MSWDYPQDCCAQKDFQSKENERRDKKIGVQFPEMEKLLNLDLGLFFPVYDIVYFG